MLGRLAVTAATLAFGATLPAQAAAQETRTRTTTSVPTLAPKPTDGQAILPSPTAVAAPTGLRASGTTQSTALAWNAVPGAIGYRVWLRPRGGVESLLTPAPIATTSFSVAGPFAPYDNYDYRVAAVHPAGESAPAIVTFNPPPPAPPPVTVGQDHSVTPTAETACMFAHRVDWAAVPGAAEYILTKTQKGNFIRLINWVRTLQYEERPSPIRLSAAQRSFATTTDRAYPMHRYTYTLVAVFQPGNFMSLPSTPVEFSPPASARYC